MGRVTQQRRQRLDDVGLPPVHFADDSDLAGGLACLSTGCQKRLPPAESMEKTHAPPAGISIAGGENGRLKLHAGRPL
jgi:hypothetical protein